jgi:hypothetical protein
MSVSTPFKVQYFGHGLLLPKNCPKLCQLRTNAVVCETIGNRDDESRPGEEQNHISQNKEKKRTSTFHVLKSKVTMPPIGARPIGLNNDV